MSFLWPYAWFFSALAIPIVIFYLIRTLPRRRSVSTLLFWEQIQPQLRSSPLWRKLRRLLSLLLQLLFLFLVIFLLARPLLPWQQKEAATVVYVVDVSASMGAREGEVSSLERARKILAGRIRQLRASDEVMIIAAGDTPRVLQRWTANRHLLLESLERLAVGAGAGNPRAALDLATDLARQRERGRVVFLSDGVIGDVFLPETDTPVERLSVAPPQIGNVGLAEFSARRSRLDRRSILIRARVVRSGAGSSPAEPPKLELTVNGCLTDVLPLSFDGDDTVEKIWNIPHEGQARIEATVRPSAPDALSSDNSATLTMDPLETLTIRLVSPPNPFLEAVLSALDGVDAARIPPEDLPPAPEEAVYVFHDARPPAGFHPPAMILLQPTGDGVWGEAPTTESGENLITDWNGESDLLRHVNLDQVLFPPFPLYTPPASAEVFAASFEDPVIFGDWDANPRWIATAFGLEETDLVYRTVFPILIGNLLRSLSLSSAVATADLPGESESLLRPAPGHLSDPEASDTTEPPQSGWLPSLPLRSWLLLLALGWTLLEWRLFHRKVTE
ncbi:MAG: vWA domain-containing protein [Puniceicoccales bacterium]